MMSFIPSICPEVAMLAQGFRALSIVVDAAEITNPGIACQEMERACNLIGNDDVPWASAHLASWGDVYRKFGAKPQRTPCSVEALRKRVARDGTLPSMDPVVDLYNAISIRYALPIGGENMDAYVGCPRLVIADGTEQFDTMKNGEVAQESPAPGEVVWRDDEGVTCRCWNWRQCVRTRLDSNAKRMWFILESLPTMPLDALYAAGNQLSDGLRQMMPGAKIEMSLIGLSE